LSWRAVLNPQKLQGVIKFALKKNRKVLGFRLFVGDVISGVGLGLFGQGHQALDPKARGNFLFQIFSRNQIKI